MGTALEKVIAAQMKICGQSTSGALYNACMNLFLAFPTILNAAAWRTAWVHPDQDSDIRKLRLAL
jgi:hypothetical protein